MSAINADVSGEIASILDCFTEPVVLIGLDYRIVAANQAYRQHYQCGDIVSKCCYEVSHRYTVPCDQAGETCPLKNSLKTGQSQRVLHVHFSPAGDEHVDVETFPVRNAQGEVVYMLEHIRLPLMASTLPQKEGLVGRSERFNYMLSLIQRVAQSDTTALLLGESGTGKELVAKAIHDNSARATQPFVPLDCSGLTETLFESELFGHEKGAFTGAHTRKIGLVEAAKGGTLFLDEVGDIPPALQVKLLRLLETGTFRRVGRTEPLKAEFRLICATHRDLKAMVEDGGFRRDLYYRINTFPIHLPALRDRIDDLELLCDSLIKRIAPKQNIQLSKGALDCLYRYTFPGNVRELRNILERASLLTDTGVIEDQHLPEECQTLATERGSPLGARHEEILPLAAVERNYLQYVLARYQGDKRSLARHLDLSERTLYRKLKSLENN